MGKIVMLLMSLLLACGVGYTQKLPKNLVLRQVTGEKIILGDTLKNECVIFTFWSTTCKPCLNELSALMEIKDAWKGKIRVLAISIDDARSMAKVKSLVKGNRWEFEVYVDVNRELYNAFNLTLIPTAMVVDETGKMAYIHTGYTPGDEAVLIDKALEIKNK